MEDHLIQGSEAWLEFRRGKIGASDAPIILGFSPYMTPRDLWLVKTGKKNVEETPAMRFGKQNEEKARLLYEKETGNIVMPKVVIHKNKNWMMASLDGISLDETILVEIKCCNKEVFDKAKKGIVDERYYAQVQHQLYCCETVEKAHFFCLHKDQTALVEVERDFEFIDEMIIKEEEFYQFVINDEEPSLSEKDSMLIEDEEFLWAAECWKKSYTLLQEAQEIEKNSRQALLDLTDDGNCHGGGVVIRRVCRKGIVDYAAIPELQNIDIEKYRKPEISYVKVSLESEKI